MAEYPRDWMDRAACQEVPDPDALFFPEKGSRAAAIKAKAICATCPVIPQCAAFVASTGDVHGIWAGTSPRQRRPSHEPPEPKGGHNVPTPETTAQRPKRIPHQPCTFPGCDRPRHSYGLCNAHTLQKRRGSQLTPIRTRRPVETPAPPRTMDT